MRYTLALETPKEFHHEIHRPMHFLNFADTGAGAAGDSAVGGAAEGGAEGDREDVFS